MYLLSILNKEKYVDINIFMQLNLWPVMNLKMHASYLKSHRHPLNIVIKQYVYILLYIVVA